MHVKSMDSMSLKIFSFLKNVGVEAPLNANVSQLVSYFEKEYGLQMMGFLESEWLHEQLDRDLTVGPFAELRMHVQESQLDDFDSDVAAIYL